MTGKLVLMTGTTGHVGFRTLREALSKGYKVRAAIRNESSINKIRSVKSIQEYLSHLTFVVVPDITVEGAFDEAIKDVDFVVHIASPLAKPSEDPEATIIQPAIRGTLSILHSALKTPSVKKVVITSSVAAVAPFEPVPFTPENIVEDPEPPYESLFAAYRASKIKAYNATRRFVRERKPGFDVINVMPTFVMGVNELATTTAEIASGTNDFLLIPVLGRKSEIGMSTIAHVDDVAFVHIAALDSSIKGNQNFGVNYRGQDGGIEWNSAIEVVKKEFPDAVARGIVPLGGSLPSTDKRYFDASKTEAVFGIQFRGYEDAVKEVVGQYIEAWKREHA